MTERMGSDQCEKKGEHRECPSCECTCHAAPGKPRRNDAPMTQPSAAARWSWPMVAP